VRTTGETTKRVYVRPRDGEWEVLTTGDRRGPRWAKRGPALIHARAIARRYRTDVTVLNDVGKVVDVRLVPPFSASGEEPQR
jgi:hypothetical protein